MQPLICFFRLTETDGCVNTQVHQEPFMFAQLMIRVVQPVSQDEQFVVVFNSGQWITLWSQIRTTTSNFFQNEQKYQVACQMLALYKSLVANTRFIQTFISVLGFSQLTFMILLNFFCCFPINRLFKCSVAKLRYVRVFPTFTNAKKSHIRTYLLDQHCFAANLL